MKKLFFTIFIFFCGYVFANDTQSFKVGDIEFIAIKDADTNMGKAILLEPNDEVVQKVMNSDQNPSSVNTFLLKTKDELVLIDTGFGKKGNLLKNLKALNIEPEQINTILLSHMHGDHIGGLVNDGKKVFENAKILVHEDELKYWLDKKTKNSDLAKEVNAIYANSLQTFSWDESIYSNIKPLNATGHTPGHTFFEINSNGEKLVVVADIVHVLNVQVAKPSISVVFDVDPKQAAKTREVYFKKFADEKTKIAGMHILFPGVGYILSDGENSYKFESADK
ncbi:MAG: MBL fold metallo-hydrolase [Campylobacteraceae bacterium]|jgi:glyoxylase-like metal-dependent hydrolase (beta-lactamase superfamily II)|nr:MBL fold metallo-hydrolase [Campylobacteraceae bacterium]